MREGGEEVRERVGMETMDFMEGSRDGWNGLLSPVLLNLVSFNIIIKVGILDAAKRKSSGLIQLLRPSNRSMIFAGQ